MDSRRAVVVLVIAGAAYVTAILQRTSLSVAGVVATDRFAVDATALSSLAVLQLLVYATMQIPVGVLVDRFGPRALIGIGAVVMAAGQLVLAIAPDIAVAVLGRILVGAGDAMTFISVLRLLGYWFSPRRLPVLSQWVGTLGQSGAILAAAPMTWAFGALGWTGAYLVSATVGVVLALGGVVLLRDAPGERHHRGAAMALYSCTGFSGAFLGPLLFGISLDVLGDKSLIGWWAAFALMGLLLLLGPLALWWAGKAQSESALRQPRAEAV